MPDQLTSTSCVVRKEKKHSHIIITDPTKGRFKTGRVVNATDALGSIWSGKVLSNPKGDGKTSSLSLKCLTAVHPMLEGKLLDDLTPSMLTVTLDPETAGADTVTTTVTYVEDDPDACSDA